MGAVQEGVDRKVEPLLDERQREKLAEWIRKGRERRLRIALGRFQDQEGTPEHIWYAAAVGDLELMSAASCCSRRQRRQARSPLWTRGLRCDRK